jgi:hypothetical protein
MHVALSGGEGRDPNQSAEQWQESGAEIPEDWMRSMVRHGESLNSL